MNIAKVDPNKIYQKKLTILRLSLLIVQLIVILSNRLFDSRKILIEIPQLNSTQTQEFKDIYHDFEAANTFALVFIVMQFLILYVGTNRWRVGPTFYCAFLHIVGIFAYSQHNRWQFQNIWTIFYIFGFLPLISEIAIALYTAKV